MIVRYSRSDCGSFARNGMFGSEHDFVRYAMVFCSDGSKRLFDFIACSQDVYVIATRQLETLPITGDLKAIAEYYFLGTRIIEHRDLPFGTLKLYRREGDDLDCAAKLSGWTV